MSHVITSLLKGKHTNCSHGKQIRDFMYVKDVAAAFVNLLGGDVTGPVNIGTCQPLSLQEVIIKIASKIDRVNLLRLGTQTAEVDDPPVILADNYRLLSEAKWTPEYDLDSGLDETIVWWKECLERRTND